jgi:hypothetical protein
MPRRKQIRWKINARLTPLALNEEQFGGLMGEDFCKERCGEVIDFVEDPAGTDKSKKWREARRGVEEE